MRIAIGYATGLLFGLGLVISGLSDPAKVLNFLDPFGSWDPSLAFVMAGAVLATAIGFSAARGRRAPLFAPAFDWPARTDIEPRLVAGAALFGLGWGLGGFCPGPALTALPLAEPGTLAFVPAMLAGILLARLLPPAR
ncbi:MAG: DUF6691 family protein [Acetobacterales bacterium]